MRKMKVLLLYLINITTVIHVSAEAQFEPFLVVNLDRNFPEPWSLPQTSIPSVDDNNIVPTCPPEAEIDKNQFQSIIEQFPEAKYCLYGKKCAQGNRECCKEEVKPMFISVISDSCGNSPNHVLYSFGFYFCGSEGILKRIMHSDDRAAQFRFYLEQKEKNKIQFPRFFSIYHICFDTAKVKTIWTRHEINTPEMFSDNIQRLQEENGRDGPISTDPFSFVANTFTTEQQKYATQDEMIATFMVPKEHVALRVWRKTVTHFLNVAPLWNRLQKLMTAVNAGIKKIALELHSKSRHLVIDTTVEEKETNTNGYFPKNIWYKLLYVFGEKGIAVLIILDSAPEMASETFECKEKVDCKIERWYEKQGQDDEGISPDILQYRYCCYPNTSDVTKIFKSFIADIEGPLILDQYLK